MGRLIDMMRFRSKPSFFEDLLRPHVPSLYSAAFRLSGNKADAEDLVQDLLVKLVVKQDQLAEVQTLRPWLMTVLYRTFVDRKRKSNRSPLVLVSSFGKKDGNGLDFFDTVPSFTPGPRESLEKMFTQKKITAALDSLNENQRTLCVLHDIEGYTLIELEEILDTPLGTLKSRLHRARARLRKILSQGTIDDCQTSVLGKG